MIMKEIIWYMKLLLCLEIGAVLISAILGAILIPLNEAQWSEMLNSTLISILIVAGVWLIACVTFPIIHKFLDK